MRSAKELRPRTREFDSFALGSLSAFFGDLPMGAITAGHLREYQIARAANELRMEDGLGCAQQDDFLFPFRVRRNVFDPKRPASRSWIRKDWEHLRKATKMPALKPHDLRHLFVTRMLEAGIRPEIVQSMSGHKNRRMMEYYSHFDLAPKAEAVDLLEARALPPKKPMATVREWPKVSRLAGEWQ